MKLKDNKVVVYAVDPEYRNWLRQFEPKVSLKEERRFVGLLVKEGETNYCVPLTSNHAHKNLHSEITTIIQVQGRIIGALLFNNMIPVPECALKKVDIDNDKDKWRLQKEVRVLRTKRNEIVYKAHKMLVHYSEIPFYKNISCDFKKLESIFEQWKPKNEKTYLIGKSNEVTVRCNEINDDLFFQIDEQLHSFLCECVIKMQSIEFTLVCKGQEVIDHLHIEADELLQGVGSDIKFSDLLKDKICTCDELEEIIPINIS